MVTCDNFKKVTVEENIWETISIPQEEHASDSKYLIKNIWYQFQLYFYHLVPCYLKKKCVETFPEPKETPMGSSSWNQGVESLQCENCGNEIAVFGRLKKHLW